MDAPIYPTISFSSSSFQKQLTKSFREYGVVVVENVFDGEFCDERVKEILDDFVKLGSGINLEDIEGTWTDYNLPPQTRPGLFQCLMSNLKAVWRVRAHKNVRKIFEILYSDLRNKAVKDFVVSSDGINVRPGIVGPYTSKDWAHLDQSKGGIFDCIQGQAVLTNTSASFVATPKSHLRFEESLELSKHQSVKGDFLKFDLQSIKSISSLFGDQWQIPILASKGAFIVWTSSTIHSARLQTRRECPTKDDLYAGWRCVVYVCYRPRDEMTKAELKRRKKAYDENRTTNHSVKKLANKNPRGRFEKPGHPCIESFLKNHETVYAKLEKPELGEEAKTLL